MSTSISGTLDSQGTSAVAASAPPPPPPVHEQKSESAAINSPHFTSPVVKVDNDTGLALLLVRDTDNGDVQAQYPAKQVVQEYGRHMRSGGADQKRQSEGGGQQPTQGQVGGNAAPAAAAAAATSASSGSSAPTSTGDSAPAEGGPAPSNPEMAA